MKILICGAGRITDELLKRISEHWEISIIDKSAEKLSPYANRFPSVVSLLCEDASSPVVLEKAEIKEQDCVLALTDDDRVNLAVVRFAREAEVKYILALVRDTDMLPEFRKLEIWTVPMSAHMARRIYQFLRDPSIEIFVLGEGDGELMELYVAKKDLPGFSDIVGYNGPDWRLVGVLRDKELLFPNRLDVIEEGDRLLILGKKDLYKEFGTRLKDGRAHFPRVYGQGMLLGVPDKAVIDLTELLNETFYWVQSAHIEKIKAIFEKPSDEIREVLSRWSEILPIEVSESEGKLKASLMAAADQGNIGLVLVPYTELSFWKAIFGSDLVDMAGNLPCPLLLCRHTDPYKRILVPFNGTPASEHALEIAVDLAGQIKADVSVIIVVEPSYIHGEQASSGEWEKRMLQQVRDLARRHETRFDEQVRHGNPVKEIVAAADEYQLMVVGRGEGETGLFSLDVTNMLLHRAPCSVLLVA
ncbi:MAG: NAD-binding protein [Deltaproteobacteria bacterium]|nr:NAD-binding protein [Deltaproteobacteria bacterium]